MYTITTANADEQSRQKDAKECHCKLRPTKHTSRRHRLQIIISVTTLFYITASSVVTYYNLATFSDNR